MLTQHSVSKWLSVLLALFVEGPNVVDTLTHSHILLCTTMFSGGSLSCEPLSPAERKKEYNNLSGHFFCLTTLNLETFLQASSANVTEKYDSKLHDWDIN